MIVAALSVALGVGSPPAVHPHELVRDATCPGCVLVGDGSTAKLPLIVVLHGDEGSPRKVATAWTPLAERGLCKAANGAARVCSVGEAASDKRTFRVLAPLCPKELGCSGSWWRWNGDPAWIFERVGALGERVDPTRVHVAGWSGGATYIGIASPEWFPRAASLSLAGGGAPSHHAACFAGAGGSCGPVHHLMGDANPLFEFAERSRQSFERCGHEVEWTLLRGADHAAEWRAYQARLPEIAAWLLDHGAGCKAPAAHGEAAASATPTSSAGPAPSVKAGPATSAVPDAGTHPTPRRGGCACSARDDRPTALPGLSVALAFCVLRLKRRRW